MQQMIWQYSCYIMCSSAEGNRKLLRVIGGYKEATVVQFIDLSRQVNA